MWKQPWGYAEGAVICSGLFITGTALQFTTGPVNANLFQYPINLLFGIFYMVCMIVLHLNKKKSAAIRWLSGMEASITSIVAFLVMVLIMGVTAQTPQGASVEEKDFLTNLGFRQLTNSWSFVLIFLYMLTVLLLTTLRKTLKYKTGNIGFLLNHAGFIHSLMGVQSWVAAICKDYIWLLKRVLRSGGLPIAKAILPNFRWLFSWRNSPSKNILPK